MLEPPSPKKNLPLPEVLVHATVHRQAVLVQVPAVGVVPESADLRSLLEHHHLEELRIVQELLSRGQSGGTGPNNADPLALGCGQSVTLGHQGQAEAQTEQQQAGRAAAMPEDFFFPLVESLGLWKKEIGTQLKQGGDRKWQCPWTMEF